MTYRKRLKRLAGTLLAADERAYRSLQPYQKAVPVRLLSQVGELGDQPQLRMVAGVTAVVGIVSKDRHLLRAAVRMIVAHEAATLLKGIIKRRVDRFRPKKAKRRDDRKLKDGKHTSKAQTSFPSGHSAGAFAVCQAFLREFPEYRTRSTLAAGTIAAAQVPKCSHYVTDVAAGVAVGLVAERMTNGALEALMPLRGQRDTN